MDGLEQLCSFEVNLDFQSRQQLFLLQKEVVQAERDKRLNAGTLSPEYEKYLQFVIERAAKCLMINGNYNLAIGCQSQLVRWWRQDYDKIKQDMDLWNHDLINVSLLTDNDLLKRLEESLLCTRRELDHTKVLMHNSNFIDAENAWKQACDFSKYASSIVAVLQKDRQECAGKASVSILMAECLARAVKGVQFDIDTGKMCHFKVAQAKAQSKSVFLQTMDLPKWCLHASQEYESARCNRCFKCRAAIGSVYGFWGAGWDGKWEVNYEPKVQTWTGVVKNAVKHGLVLGAQIAAFSAIFLAATQGK